MNTTLQPDGSLLLDDATETRVITPMHPAYGRLMELYQRNAAVALSVAAEAPPRKVAAPANERFQGFSDEWTPVSLSAGYGGFPWKGGMPEFDTVYPAVPVECITADPDPELQMEHRDNEKYQGRFNPRQSFDATKLGVLVAWRDPATGKTRLVDGLIRLERAKEARIESVPLRYIDAKTADEARKIGLKLNRARQAEHEQDDAESDRMAFELLMQGVTVPAGWSIKPVGGVLGLFRAGRNTPVATASTPHQLLARITTPKGDPEAQAQRRAKARQERLRHDQENAKDQRLEGLQRDLEQAKAQRARLDAMMRETEGWDDEETGSSKAASSAAKSPTKRVSIFNKPKPDTSKAVGLSGNWDESKHPRGQPENAGEFGPGGGHGAAPAPTKAPQRQDAGQAGKGGGAAAAPPAQAEAQQQQQPQQQSPEEAAADYQKNGVAAKAFKAWFGDWEAAKKTGSSLWGVVSAVIDRITGKPKETYPVEPSVVTDEQGKPIVVYNGRGDRFDEFKYHHDDGTPIVNVNAQYGPGFYFSEAEDFAASFVHGSGLTGGNKGTDPNVVKVYLNIKKPFDADAWLKRLATAPGHAKLLTYGMISDALKGNAQATAKLKELGYDGITHTDTYEGKKHRVWVAFHANQIKSVDNRGTFDPNSNKMALSTALSAAGQETVEDFKAEAVRALRKMFPLSEDDRRHLDEDEAG